MKRVLLRFVCASLVTMMCMGLAGCDSFWYTPDNPVNVDDPNNNSGQENTENIELTPEQVAETMEQLKAAQKEGAQITIAYAYKGVDYEATFERQGDDYALVGLTSGLASTMAEILKLAPAAPYLTVEVPEEAAEGGEDDPGVTDPDAQVLDVDLNAPDDGADDEDDGDDDEGDDSGDDEDDGEVTVGEDDIIVVDADEGDDEGADEGDDEDDDEGDDEGDDEDDDEGDDEGDDDDETASALPGGTVLDFIFGLRNANDEDLVQIGIDTDKAVATMVGDVDGFTLKSITTNGSSSEPAVRTRAAGQKITVKVKKNAKGDIKLTKVTLSAKKLKIKAGKKKKLKVTIEPKNATIKKMYWETKNEKIASISKGTKKSVKVKVAMKPTDKSTKIRVSVTGINSKTKTCNVSVPWVDVKKVTIKNAPKEMTAGKRAKFTITLSPSNVTSKTVKCTSSNKKVATVDNQGNVLAKSPGTAKITVTATNGTKDPNDDKKATFTVTVKAATIAVESITLDPSSLDLVTGGIATLTATVKPDNATDRTVIWGTTDADVATVTNGVVFAVGPGTATITAKAGDLMVTCPVTVKAKPVVTSITLDPTSLELETGSTAKLTATVYPSNITDAAIAWITSNAKVATVKDGVVTAVGPGTATITVTTGGKSDTCTVTVKDKPSGIGDPVDYDGGGDPFN